ncbi:MAG: plasmid related protein [Anaerolineae bacterium]|nr:plasmid related protein [Anaerolineae bacterium]MCO5205649.1 plasmid related protein [Anaerolineae bacterium]
MGETIDLLTYLKRHANCDWGDLDATDARTNDQALRDGLRLLSAYDTPAGKLWIISEADRSVTTLLLPEEY